MKVTSEPEVNLVPRSQMPLLGLREGPGGGAEKASEGRQGDHCLLPFPVIPLTSGGSAQVTYCRKTARCIMSKAESFPSFLSTWFFILSYRFKGMASSDPGNTGNCFSGPQ